MKSIIFIDPGEKCGWVRADVDDKGNWHRVRHGITPLKDMAITLNDKQNVDAYAPVYDVIGYEVFRLYKTHALQQVGSDMQTSQMVGMIRLIAWLSGSKIVSQGANAKRPAEASAPPWLKKYLAKFPKRHDEAHDYDALLHLWSWTFKNYDVNPRTHTGGMDA
jgi:hypothetical protein